MKKKYIFFLYILNSPEYRNSIVRISGIY